MMNMIPALRSGCSGQALAARAWACGPEGVQPPSTGATAFSACAEANRDTYLGIRYLSHWFCQAAVRDTGATCGRVDSTRLPDALYMSTAAAASSSTAGSTVSGHQTQQGRLEPVTDISPSRIAKLADELDPPSASGSDVKGRQIRHNRRPVANGSSTANTSTLDSSWGVSNDAAVKAVFDKLVGNLTKSGKKATARRIVLDAVRVMQGHLRKGDLDKIK
ncbi:hypothetical protein Vretimale_420 [Volvox reticuliferus]|uniref:Uncharacterized protein n=1 Tax=Volvox reticuliferus TaxID=1737510 RepID=A0A8J4BZ92_9CHLO|nr:hypothetical protein Vretifemale_2652 [Volvox reticuliferus]GIL94086.1 hypothetical protein Vretimale_420 [Volvox reticuliferus]